jgi:ubiquinone/menaquinone biosynthesis C-methylase UbiE
LYRLIEVCTIGPSLQRARLAQIEALAESGKVKSALLVGEGNGRFLLSFAQRFPLAQITVIDESARMLQLARKRLQNAGLQLKRIKFIVADLNRLPLAKANYDVIVTHFFFDNFLSDDAAQMMAILREAAVPGAHWLLADFFIPESGYLRWRARIWLCLLYLFFGMSAAVPARHLPETEKMLHELGFEALNRKTFCGDLIYSTLLVSRHRRFFT